MCFAEAQSVRLFSGLLPSGLMVLKYPMRTAENTIPPSRPKKEETDFFCFPGQEGKQE